MIEDKAGAGEAVAPCLSVMRALRQVTALRVRESHYYRTNYCCIILIFIILPQSVRRCDGKILRKSFSRTPTPPRTTG